MAGKGPNDVDGTHSQRQKKVLGLPECERLSSVEKHPALHQGSGEARDRREDDQTGEVTHTAIQW